MHRTQTNHRNTLRLISVGAIAVGVAVAIGPLRAQSAPAQPQVTFSKDIASILQRSCQNCHRPNGGLAPMALTTYEEVRPWASAIKTRTGRREMPPWYIEKGIGVQHFKDDISLSDEEIAKIATWVDTGAPRGNPADMPPPREFTDSNRWAIGEPDLVVKSPVITVRAAGPDQFPPNLGPAVSGLTEDRWIAAFQVREIRVGGQPTDKAASGFYFVIHHQVLGTAPSEGGEEAVAREPGGFQMTHEVGQNAQYIPVGVGVPLRKGGKIYFESGHYFSIGREVKVQLEVGFKFHPKGYVPKYPNKWYELPRWGLGQEMDVPGNSPNVVSHHVLVLQEPRKLLHFEPHMHTGGRRMCLEAMYPDGFRETINCSGYNHAWVKSYAYEDDYAPLLPKGTILHFTAWHNNSPSNRIVVDPRNWRGLGLRSIDEMFLFKGKTVMLTEEEYQEEVAARSKRLGMRVATHELQRTVAQRGAAIDGTAVR